MGHVFDTQNVERRFVQVLYYYLELDCKGVLNTTDIYTNIIYTYILYACIRVRMYVCICKHHT